MVDDMIWAFMKSAKYHLWLKGGSLGKRSNQASLKLNATTYTCDFKLLTKAMRFYLGVEDLNARCCAFEWSKLFGSTKRKLGLLPGSKYDSHRLDKVSYSILHPNTRFTKESIGESLTDDENVVSQFTSMLISECLEYQWNIPNCLMHWIKSATCCRPTPSMYARPKWERRNMTHPLQLIEVLRSIVLTTMYLHNFGLAYKT